MTTRINLQIPVTVNIKTKAEQKAEKQGFSSIQEVVRVFLKNYIDGNISVTFGGESLTANAIERYENDLRETKEAIKKGDIAVYRTKEEALNHVADL